MDKQINVVDDLLGKISKFLIKEHIVLTKGNSDGRVNSSHNEAEILDKILHFTDNDKDFLENKITIKKPDIRDWYDFAIEKKSLNINEKELFFPVNIKVTSTKSADNLNCKLGIYYALTGLKPFFSNECTWDYFFKKLAKDLNIKENKNDYYFLIVNKDDTKDIFYSSLKKIKNLVPNGSNLPFQCQWGENREKVDRTQEESVHFVLSKLADSINARVEAVSIFYECFPEFNKVKEKINEKK